MTKRSERGMALSVVVLMLAVLAILIPLMVQWIQKEAKDTVRESKKTTSFHLAEVGQDRGAWKLRESDTVWSNAVAGLTLTNYDGSFEFVDVPGGSYKVQFTPGPGPAQVTILSKGKAANTTEVRAIRAVYT